LIEKPNREAEMKTEEERSVITFWDIARIILLFVILGLVLATPLLNAHALNVTVQTEEGELPPDGSMKLTFQQLEVAIHNQVAAGQSWFHFRNDFEADVEVTCEFALNPAEIVEGFSYYNGDERIVGEVLEKSAAEEVYQELTQVQRRDPGILEQTGDSFRFRVYPVQPGENKPVEFRHLSPLAAREGIIEYRIPRENLPGESTVFSLSVDITDDLPIADVETVGFEGLVKTFGPRPFRVVYEAATVDNAQDFIIRYRVQADDYAMRFVAHKSPSEEGTFMLVVTPKAEVEKSDVIGRDIVFVMDISGSMQGDPLEQTKHALMHILGELNPDDRFDVVAFDDQASPFFGDLRRADGSTTGDARDRVSELKSRGGTNILNAMKKALDLLAASRTAVDDRPRAIIFLTDGQGMNPASVIISEVRKRDAGVRVYTFGVGSGVNRPFLERLARDNRGIATLVQDANRLEAEMRRLYERISMPLMVDLELDFHGMNVTSVYPQRLPDLYRDGEVVVFGRFSHAGSGRVEVTGRLKGREKSLALEVSLPGDEPRYSYAEKLWASHRINDLMDAIRDQGGADELQQEVTRLGIVYNLVTEYTTFLAVPESLKTHEIKEMIRKGKQGYDKKLIDSIEGIKLSQAAFPPGDPVLSVDAPVNARKVVAFFPFGLTKRMKFDPIREQWSCRFLVPRDVADGLYEIKVLIIDGEGGREWRNISYYIDGTAPEFEADLPATAAAGETISVEVDPFETVQEVYGYLPEIDDTRILFKLDPESGTYLADITMPTPFCEGPVTLRIVVRDEARNRFERDFEIWEADELEEDLPDEIQ